MTPTNEKEIAQLLSACAPEIAELSLAVREWIMLHCPFAVEVVWVRQKNIGFGTGPKKKTEHFCWLMPATAHVTLGFNYGAELPDHSGLLRGTGKFFRHVKIKDLSQLQDCALIELLRFAASHRVPRPDANQQQSPRKITDNENT